LIDLNEEIFTLSEEVANSYQSNNTRAFISAAREFEIRKKQLIKKVSLTIEEDPVAKIVRREQRTQS
jgi:PIN domain nuclease of toxin-antitoxin system